MKLTGDAILISRGMKVLQAAPAAYPYRSATEATRMWRVYVLSGLIACVVAAVTAYVTVRLALPGGSAAPTATPQGPPAPGSAELEPFEQSGPFDGSGGQGEVHFPIPFASLPNVKLDYIGRTTVVAEVKPTGFKWKDIGAGSHAAKGTWTAIGVKATKLP
jgi:hypothetical protein